MSIPTKTELLELQCELVDVKAELNDTRIVARFWRGACEQALDEWNKAEDQRDELRKQLADLRDEGSGDDLAED